MIEVFQTPWENKLLWKIKEVEASLFIISPYIKKRVAELIIAAFPPTDYTSIALNILTRFDYNDFLSGASDFEALELIHNYSKKGLKKEIRFINNLHSKIYLFDSKEAIITSSNLTTPGLNKNIEIGISLFNKQTVNEIKNIVSYYWDSAEVLTDNRLTAFEKLLFDPKLIKNKEILSESNKEIVNSTLEIDPTIATLLLDKAIIKPNGEDEEQIGLQTIIKSKNRFKVKRSGKSKIQIIKVEATNELHQQDNKEIIPIPTEQARDSLQKEDLKVGESYKAVVKDITKQGKSYVYDGQKYYGAYTVKVEINGIEGIVLFLRHPRTILNIDDFVDVTVEVNNEDVLLLQINTLNKLKDAYPIGSRVSGVIKSISRHIWVAIDNTPFDKIAGMIPRRDYAWNLSYKEVYKMLNPFKKIEAVEAIVEGYSYSGAHGNRPTLILNRKKIFNKPPIKKSRR